MYCKNCGKELSEEAIMCPDCGTPTGNKSNMRKSAQGGTQVPLSFIALFLGCFSFVTGIIFGAFFYVYTAASLLFYVIGATSILPALTTICLGITALTRETESHSRILTIIAIVLAGVTLLFLFLTVCIIIGGIGF